MVQFKIVGLEFAVRDQRGVRWVVLLDVSDRAEGAELMPVDEVGVD